MLSQHDPHDPIGCRWIDGDPKLTDWSYCQRVQRADSPYCNEHHRRAYVRQSETAKQEKAA